MCSLDTEQFIIVTLILLKETLIDHLLCALCCIYNNKQYEVLPPKNLTKTLIKFQGDTKVFSQNKVKAEIRVGSILLEKKSSESNKQGRAEKQWEQQTQKDNGMTHGVEVKKNK